MKKDFHAFMKKNKKKVYDLVKKDCKYDKHGHLLLPSTDPWMSDNKLDVYSQFINKGQHYGKQYL